MITCDGARCTVEGPITFDTVVELLAQGNEAFAAPETVVDLGKVTEVDSSALSLLLEWRREAGRRGRTIRYLNLPANLTSLAQLYDVTGLLGEQ